MATNTRRGQLELIRVMSEDRLLGDLALAMAAALPARPAAVAGKMDELGRGDRRVHHPAHRAVEIARACMQDALATHDLDVIAETRARVANYFLACTEAALGEAPDLVADREVTIAVVKEAGEAVSAVVVARETRTPSALERARLEVQQAIDAGRAFLRTAGWASPLPRPSDATPLRAVR